MKSPDGPKISSSPTKASMTNPAITFSSAAAVVILCQQNKLEWQVRRTQFEEPTKGHFVWWYLSRIFNISPKYCFLIVVGNYGNTIFNCATAYYLYVTWPSK